mmetsp:Transcript_15804/g.40434  ORF Transcript_15804/g.40434 Transcript_15804/m.40434 type:complete len:307 (-) Transcript_15804:19-939(-)
MPRSFRAVPAIALPSARLKSAIGRDPLRSTSSCLNSRSISECVTAVGPCCTCAASSSSTGSISLRLAAPLTLSARLSVRVECAFRALSGLRELPVSSSPACSSSGLKGFAVDFGPNCSQKDCMLTLPGSCPPKPSSSTSCSACSGATSIASFSCRKLQNSSPLISAALSLTAPASIHLNHCSSVCPFWCVFCRRILVRSRVCVMDSSCRPLRCPLTRTEERTSLVFRDWERDSVAARPICATAGSGGLYDRSAPRMLPAGSYDPGFTCFLRASMCDFASPPSSPSASKRLPLAPSMLFWLAPVPLK